MDVLVVGANGKIGAQLVARLAADGDRVRAMVRDDEQAERAEQAGAEAVLADLTGDEAPLREAMSGADAVAFCAGSGPHTGPDRTLLVDLHGAVRTIDLAVELGVDRYVMCSSMAADDPQRGPEAIQHYLAAKHAADRVLTCSGLQATIVRPGGLTDDEATGAVSLGVPRLGERGQIPRADVAAVMATCLHDPSTAGATFEVVSGETPIADLAQHL